MPSWVLVVRYLIESPTGWGPEYQWVRAIRKGVLATRGRAETSERAANARDERRLPCKIPM